MRALWLTAPGGLSSFALREQPDPQPRPGTVRIRTRAIGLNFADVLASQGMYPGAPSTPCVLGYEAAGVVDAAGSDAESALVGKRVVAMVPFGGHADTVIATRDQCFDMPDEMTFDEAAALPVNWLTAWHMLFEIAHVRPGESVLVHMAAGGVGTSVLQLCRTIGGVTTFGTASAAKHGVLREYGCTYPIDYRTTDYAEEINRITGGTGIDVVLDPLGGDDTRKGLSLLRTGGRIVCFGFANLVKGDRRSLLRVIGQVRKISKISPLDLIDRNQTVAGFHLGRMFDATDVLSREMAEVTKRYVAGSIRPRIDSTHPLERWREAFDRIVDGKNVGKVLLTT